MIIFDGFDWDAGNWPKCGKHGLTRSEIESAFEIGLTIFPDENHSSTEERYIAFGKTLNGRNVFIIFTIRQVEDVIKIRPISARYMHQKEVQFYEKQKRT